LFSFSLLAIYGILLSLSVRKRSLKATGVQEEIS
jgi:hypothetical protein